MAAIVPISALYKGDLVREIEKHLTTKESVEMSPFEEASLHGRLIDLISNLYEKMSRRNKDDIRQYNQLHSRVRSLFPASLPEAGPVMSTAVKAVEPAASTAESAALVSAIKRSKLKESSSDSIKCCEATEEIRSSIVSYFPSLFVQRPSKVDWTPDYLSLFTRLDRLAASREEAFYSCSPVLRDVKRSQVPPVLHYIWLGGSVPARFYDNIKTNAGIMRERFNGISVLWTDQEEVSEEMRSFLLKESIFLVHVDDVFGNEEMMEFFPYYKAAVAKVPPNYGEASDLLRYEILDFLGGVYFDCDVPAVTRAKSLTPLLGSMLHKRIHPDIGTIVASCYTEVDTELTGSILLPANNDSLASIPKAKFLGFFKEGIHRRYAHFFPCNERRYYQNTTKKPYYVEDVLVRTGPCALQEMLELFIKEHKPKAVRSKEFCDSYAVVRDKESLITAGTWIADPKKVAKITFSSDFERKERITHDLIVSVLHVPCVLDIEKYRPYLSDLTQEEQQLFLESVISRAIHAFPHLFNGIDRIFVSTVHEYEYYKSLLAKYRPETKWREDSVLLFAAKMGANDLALHLVKKGYSFFDVIVADTFFYSCELLVPISEALMAHNFELILALFTECPELFSEEALKKRFDGCRSDFIVPTIREAYFLLQKEFLKNRDDPKADSATVEKYTKLLEDLERLSPIFSPKLPVAAVKARA